MTLQDVSDRLDRIEFDRGDRNPLPTAIAELKLDIEIALRRERDAKARDAQNATVTHAA